MHEFDVLVLGGGQAGVEAACAAARMGARTGLITLDPEKIGAMSCNPAIGGLGKGHLVREVDALDGVIGRAADAAAIHYRMLNRSKGSAVWGPRVQADRKLFHHAVQQIVREQSSLEPVAGEVAGLRLAGGRVVGLDLADGTALHAKSVILCTGTFLGGILFRGEERYTGGGGGGGGPPPLSSPMRGAGVPPGRGQTREPPPPAGRATDRAIP
ncbi:MAG: FAD-dependent oxidoreductase, partial [Erythrobacter sp.]